MEPIFQRSLNTESELFPVYWVPFYLGYSQPVGEHLKYIAFCHDRPIACLAWRSAPWYIGARDRFIGWSKKIREKNLHLIANNLRFLILPWVQVPCLASYLLALNRHFLSQDWQNLYHHPVYLLETFVDTERYPVPPLIREEHRSYLVWCPKCGKIHYMPFPPMDRYRNMFSARSISFQFHTGVDQSIFP